MTVSLTQSLQGPEVLALPLGLRSKECACQDEVKKEETEPSPGVQSPQHGENHLLYTVPTVASACPSPSRTELGANPQGHLTKDISSRAQRQYYLFLEKTVSQDRVSLCQQS